MKKDDQRGAKKQPKPNDRGEAPLPAAGETVVRYDETATKPSSGKQIHPRRPLPKVPERGPTPDPGAQKPDE
jgi:hypothetical protein